MKVELRDTSGNLLQTLLNESVKKGAKTYTRDLSGLRKGIYIYTVQIDGNVQTKKIIKN